MQRSLCIYNMPYSFNDYDLFLVYILYSSISGLYMFNRKMRPFKFLELTILFLLYLNFANLYAQDCSSK